MTSDQLIIRLYEVVLQPVLLLLLGIAAVWFVMGILQFISGAKIEERRQKGLRHLDQGLIGMIIMFSVFGIISMLANTIGSDDPTDLYDRGNEFREDQFIRPR